MTERFNPKFNVTQTYSRDDFIFRLEAIIDQNQSDSVFMQVLEDNIAWASKLAPDAQISFEFAEDGTIFPVTFREP